MDGIIGSDNRIGKDITTARDSTPHPCYIFRAHAAEVTFLEFWKGNSRMTSW